MLNWNVYLVMDLNGYGNRTAYDIAAEAINGGIEVLQIREKNLASDQFVLKAKPIQKLCKEKGVSFIINDFLDLAVELDADGIHVGQDDISGKEARRRLGKEKIIGISASSIEEAKKALDQGADYLGVGSIYPTSTKADAGEAVSPSLVREIRNFTSIPIVGIGGIHHGNAGPVILAGGNAVAVVSAICHSDSPNMAAKRIKEEVLQAKP